MMTSDPLKVILGAFCCYKVVPESISHQIVILMSSNRLWMACSRHSGIRMNVLVTIYHSVDDTTWHTKPSSHFHLWHPITNHLDSYCMGACVVCRCQPTSSTDTTILINNNWHENVGIMLDNAKENWTEWQKADSVYIGVLWIILFIVAVWVQTCLKVSKNNQQNNNPNTNGTTVLIVQDYSKKTLNISVFLKLFWVVYYACVFVGVECYPQI